METPPAPTLEELKLPAQQGEKPDAWVKPELPTSNEIPAELPPVEHPRTYKEIGNSGVFISTEAGL